MNLIKFLEVLFDLHESTCYSKNARGTSVSRYPENGDEFFCINPLHPEKDLIPQRGFHAPNKPRRADHNVIAYRNFLLELDDMPVNKQMQLIDDRRLPVSAVTYSGDKSLHFIISLKEPLKNLEEYKLLAARLHAYIPEADSSTKNPSRFSRLPEATRQSTGKKQELLRLGTRISYEELDALLPTIEPIEKSPEKRRVESENRFLPVNLLEACYEPEKIMLLKNINGRNAFFFWLGNRLKEIQLSKPQRRELVERAYFNLQSAKGFSISEAFMAARVD